MFDNYSTIVSDYNYAMSIAKAQADEETVRELLGRWVSELEPAIAYRNGEIIGLVPADAPLGSEPFILKR